MYFIYILKSDKDGSYYVGQTADLAARLARHNIGSVPSTRGHAPYKMIYHESYPTRSAAVQREHEIKSYKGGSAFKKLIGEI